MVLAILHIKQKQDISIKIWHLHMVNKNTLGLIFYYKLRACKFDDDDGR
jgi:hypothetical protein